MVRRTLGWSLTLVGILSASPLQTQEPPLRVLSQPQAVFEVGLYEASELHELTNGNVMLLDRQGGDLYLLDSQLRLIRQVGRRGNGPNEFPCPHRLFSLPGDSTAILECLTQQVKVLAPDGTVVRQRPGRGCHAAQAAGFRPVTATDRQGRFYSEAPLTGTPPRGRSAQEVAIVRWTEGCQVDTVAWMPLPSDARVAQVGGRRVAAPGQAPFASFPQWAVMPDGSVMVAHLDPYRVDTYRDGVLVTRGREIRFQSVRVTEAHRREWREEQSVPQSVMNVSRDMAVRFDRRVLPFAEPRNWPRQLPPFLPGAVHVSSEGRLWVQRTTAAGAPSVFDVFSDSGAVVARVQLPPGRRLVGFGRGVVYLAGLNDDELEVLERYRIPGS